MGNSLSALPTQNALQKDKAAFKPVSRRVHSSLPNIFVKSKTNPENLVGKLRSGSLRPAAIPEEETTKNTCIVSSAPIAVTSPAVYEQKDSIETTVYASEYPAFVMLNPMEMEVLQAKSIKKQSCPRTSHHAAQMPSRFHAHSPLDGVASEYSLDPINADKTSFDGFKLAGEEKVVTAIPFKRTTDRKPKTWSPYASTDQLITSISNQNLNLLVNDGAAIEPRAEPDDFKSHAVPKRMLIKGLMGNSVGSMKSMRKPDLRSAGPESKELQQELIWSSHIANHLVRHSSGVDSMYSSISSDGKPTENLPLTPYQMALSSHKRNISTHSTHLPKEASNLSTVSNFSDPSTASVVTTAQVKLLRFVPEANMQAKNYFDSSKRLKFNSMSTLYVDRTILNMDTIELIDIIAKHIRGIMIDNMNHTLTKTHDIFSEELYNLSASIRFYKSMPTLEDVIKYMQCVFFSADICAECILFSVVYLKRMLAETGYAIQTCNWTRMILASTILSAKVWDDHAVWTVDFCQIFPDISVYDLNNLERHFLNAISFNVGISMSTCVSLYFELRDGVAIGSRVWPIEQLKKSQIGNLKAKSSLAKDTQPLALQNKLDSVAVAGLRSRLAGKRSFSLNFEIRIDLPISL